MLILLLMLTAPWWSRGLACLFRDTSVSRNPVALPEEEQDYPWILGVPE